MNPLRGEEADVETHEAGRDDQHPEPSPGVRREGEHVEPAACLGALALNLVKIE
jgi:hypothetical protein